MTSVVYFVILLVEFILNAFLCIYEGLLMSQ